MKALTMSALVLVLAGCATAPTDLSFAPVTFAPGDGTAVTGEQPALLILAVGPIATGGAFQFQRIDTTALQFAGEPVTLAFGAWGVGDRMARPEGEPSSMWVVRDEVNFLVKTVEPGTYAASYVTWNTYNGVSSGTAWLCQDTGAPTFEIQPGQINLVLSSDAFPPGTISRLSNAFDLGDVLEQFARTRAAYPNLAGDPIVLMPTQETRWTEAPAGFFGSPCREAEEGTLSLNALFHTVAPAGAPDAAEQAAIAAARANLQRRDAVHADSAETPK